MLEKICILTNNYSIIEQAPSGRSQTLNHTLRYKSFSSSSSSSRLDRQHAILLDLLPSGVGRHISRMTVAVESEAEHRLKTTMLDWCAAVRLCCTNQYILSDCVGHFAVSTDWNTK
jgi:hypothetical protein